jgi:hypothetical protein
MLAKTCSPARAVGFGGQPLYLVCPIIVVLPSESRLRIPVAITMILLTAHRV